MTELSSDLRLSRAVLAGLLVLVLLGGVLRFYGLGRQPLWLDEQCQLAAAQSPDFATFWRVSGESGPIGRLSYFDTWLVWQCGGGTRAALRFPAALAGTLTLAAVFFLGRRWFGVGAALFATAFVAVSGLHIQYSREARGYALLVLFFLGWMRCFDATLSQPHPQRLLLLCAATVLLMAVHPVAAAGCAGAGVAVLLGWPWIKSGAGAPLVRTLLVLGSSIWIGAGIWFLLLHGKYSATANPVSVPQRFLHESIDIYKALLGGYWGVPSYAVFVLAAAGVWRGMREAALQRGAILALAVSFSALLPIGLGLWQGTYVVSRYALFALPFLFFFAGLGCEALLQRLKREAGDSLAAVAAVGLAVALLGGTFMQGRSPYDLERNKAPSTEWPNLER